MTVHLSCMLAARPGGMAWTNGRRAVCDPWIGLTDGMPVTTANTERPAAEIIATLAGFPDELARSIFSNNEPEDLLQPSSDGGWGVVEIIPHLRDWEAIYFERARRIVNEDHPSLPAFDDTLWSIERDYREQDPQTTFEEFRKTRAEFVDFLKSLPEDAWLRTGKHSYYGDIDLLWMGRHIIEHDQEHLQQARDALAS
jgi:hypothetical protein